MWRSFENLFAFLLRHASQHAKLLSLLLKFFVVVQAVERFLLGLVADRAGVVENQVGVFDCLDLLIPLRHERAYDFFRVMDVHLAAKCLEVKGLARLTLHTYCKYNPRWQNADTEPADNNAAIVSEPTAALSATVRSRTRLYESLHPRKHARPSLSVVERGFRSARKSLVTQPDQSSRSRLFWTAVLQAMHVAWL